MTTLIITSLVGHQIAFRASVSEAFGSAHMHCEPRLSCSVQFSSVAQSPWTAACQASCRPWFRFQESGDGKWLKAPGFWSWRCHACREVVTKQIILWKSVSPGCRGGWKELRKRETFGKNSASKAWQESKTPRWFPPNTYLSPPSPQGYRQAVDHHTHPRKSPSRGIWLTVFVSRSSLPKPSLPEVSGVRFPLWALNARGPLAFFSQPS